MDFKEDGELSDSGNEIAGKEESHDDSILNYQPIDRPVIQSAYVAPRQMISSESECNSSDSDDSTEFPLRKKKKLNVPPKPQPQTNKRKNNIWTNILMEEQLIDTIGSVEVKNVRKIDRSVESYELPKALADSSGGEEEPVEKQERVFRRIKRRSRYNPQNGHKSHNNDEGSPPKDDSIEKVVLKDIQSYEGMTAEALATEIADGLREEKKDLVERVVSVLGMDIALKLYNEAKKIEEHGGLMILSGRRRRTSGGVYIHLIKTSSLTKDIDTSKIFIREELTEAEKDKKRKRRYRARARQLKNYKEMQCEEGAKCPGSTPVSSPPLSDSEKPSLQFSTEPARLMEACEKAAMEIDGKKEEESGMESIDVDRELPQIDDNPF